MPMYEYVCTECSHSMDKLLRASDPEPTECPECGKHGLKRQISAAAFALKGTGWYVTDFRNKKKPASGQGTGKADGGGKKESKGSKDDKGKAAASGGDNASGNKGDKGDKGDKGGKGGKQTGGGSSTQNSPD